MFTLNQQADPWVVDLRGSVKQIYIKENGVLWISHPTIIYSNKCYYITSFYVFSITKTLGVSYIGILFEFCIQNVPMFVLRVSAYTDSMVNYRSHHSCPGSQCVMATIQEFF